MKLICSFLLLSMCWLPLFAQEEQRCGFYSSPEEKKKYAYFFDFQEKLNQEIEKRKETTAFARTEADILTIPVIVHVIHNGEPVGTGTNISAAQIKTQIDVLNEDFSNNNPYKNRTVEQFKSVADDSGIRFVLASLDPDGKVLPERGIHRVRSPNGKRVWLSSDEFDSEIKPSTIWDVAKYLNIWTIDSLRLGGSVGLGYSSFPNLSGLEGIPQTNIGNSRTDGVVIRHNRFGSAGKIDVPQLPKTGIYSYGRTTTHEVGHFFGLLHPFEGYSCAVDGDFCPDTPFTSTEASGCNLSQVRCNTLSMVQNYMDYARDTCMTLFTKDQIRRMRTVLQVSPTRLALTQSNVVSSADKILSNKVLIYPNPADRQLRITAPDMQLKNYQIYNLSGQQLTSEKFDEFSDAIDVSRLGSGMYLLQIETNKGIAVKKIIIQR
ncbi:MAG: T9SS C-terminal target domain-containing protein [Cytophagales bacterium]|nr:MAG: T9SS C-terminal target domain-containing protein [Cytophagales bacterium]